ncbi:MAG TPA: tripartite tricarboxylate transporter substrate binding protein, partial [Burkholderiales bacterium]|nr:tripartite tricarboxylate transporter substrate binding protein [Burkholderiales bacterium]
AYPARPIRFIIPFPPGGNTDVLGRLLGIKLTETFGQQVVIDNRPGAGGTLGVEQGARATPDGYTIVMGTFGSVLVANSLYKKLPYDPQRDLAPVVLVSTPPGLLITNLSVPAKTVQELVAYARANPGRLNYASSGAGTWNHLFGELFNATANVKTVHVPYKGASPAVTDLIGGQVQMMFSPFPPALPQVRSGKLRALAVSTAKRSGLLPDIPTVSESGLPGYAAEGWFAVLAPARTPAAIINKLNAELNRALQLPDVKSSLASDGAEPAGGTPEELAHSIREGSAKWAKLIRDLGMTL